MKLNHEVRHASHPGDAKGYDTRRTREAFLIERLMVEREINLVYSMHDRMITGGAVPVEEPLELASIPPLRSPFFTRRRETGIFNVGGDGMVTAGERSYALGYKEALYLGRGDRPVYFSSVDARRPARFYFNSAPAHATFPDRIVTRQHAVVMEAGRLEESNHRVINRMIVSSVLPTCQLQMGMTELKPGSTWNTMPPHTHARRMEVYFYFEVPEGQVVCHFMGEPGETRHLWTRDEQAVISPEWSIHAACATSSYTFIWGMAGENQDYEDMDAVTRADLR